MCGRTPAPQKWQGAEQRRPGSRGAELSLKMKTEPSQGGAEPTVCPRGRGEGEERHPSSSPADPLPLTLYTSPKRASTSAPVLCSEPSGLPTAIRKKSSTFRALLSGLTPHSAPLSQLSAQVAWQPWAPTPPPCSALPVPTQLRTLSASSFNAASSRQPAPAPTPSTLTSLPSALHPVTQRAALYDCLPRGTEIPKGHTWH